MKLISTRSPFFIEVNETGQAESKIELFIWEQGYTEPTTPTYTLSKQAASVSVTKNVYNISPFVKQYIENISSSFSGIIFSYTQDWKYVKVKRYYSTTPNNATPTLLDTTTYVATNGYTSYLGGYNNYINDTFIPMNLFQQNKVYKYYETGGSDYPSLTFFIDYIDDTDKYVVRYSNFEAIPSTYTETLLDGETEQEYLFNIPIRTSGEDFNDGCKIEILFNNVVISTYIFKAECEPKYKPIRIDYINKNGIWDFITFFKARTESYDVKNKEYQLLPDSVDYNYLRGESKFFNYEAKQSIKVNTGWLDESYNTLIKDLMVSETILLYDYSDSTYKPVKLKTMTTDLKTSLQDKMINYQIEFEYNYNQINNVI